MVFVHHDIRAVAQFLHTIHEVGFEPAQNIGTPGREAEALDLHPEAIFLEGSLAEFTGVVEGELEGFSPQTDGGAFDAVTGNTKHLLDAILVENQTTGFTKFVIAGKEWIVVSHTLIRLLFFIQRPCHYRLMYAKYLSFSFFCSSTTFLMNSSWSPWYWLFEI